MVVAANMAFAQIKGFKPKEIKKDYKVYKKPEVPKEKVIIKEIPTEKIVEVKMPKESKEWILEASKHARRSGKKVPENLDRFFD